ncbi:MAG: YHS domain-containing (seleno)protein [Azospirillaceae bacterium]
MASHRTFLAASALAGLLLAGTAIGTAEAGEQYVDTTGFAVSGYDVVSYFDLGQNPVGERQPAPLPGKASITAEHNGATWAFATEENRERFLADPARYVPEYDGHCAYGVALEGKVPGNPLLWRIVDGELYLNVSQTVVGFWEEDIPGFIDKAETNWSGLEPDPANANPIPEFDPSAAPVGG